MIIDLERLQDMYDAVKTEVCSSEERKVLVYVSTAECDSVCAVRILQARS